jgi:hypothetical protein
MAKIITQTEESRTQHPDGSITIDSSSKTRKVEVSNEPDYIKIYTDMWCSFNGIDPRWRELFLQLASRMSYASITSPHGGQTVIVYGAVSDEITAACGWQDKSTLRKGLKALADCKAIKHVSRSMYQINPSYAGRGEWKYNPRLDRGGVENIIATFDFAAGTIDTKVTFADDGSDHPLNELYRKAFSAAPKDRLTVTNTKVQSPGQMDITEWPEALA